MATPWTIPTRPTGTAYDPRASVNAPNWGLRNDVTFLMTEVLDFLMTEDDDYLITDESNFIDMNWQTRPII